MSHHRRKPLGWYFSHCLFLVLYIWCHCLMRLQKLTENSYVRYVKFKIVSNVARVIGLLDNRYYAAIKRTSIGGRPNEALFFDANRAQALPDKGKKERNPLFETDYGKPKWPPRCRIASWLYDFWACYPRPEFTVFFFMCPERFHFVCQTFCEGLFSWSFSVILTDWSVISIQLLCEMLLMDQNS